MVLLYFESGVINHLAFDFKTLNILL